MTVYFGVKYYASDPCKLAEEITRYQFFLQCKQDILHSRLPISLEMAIELFALAVQSELGDYDPQRHQEGYVSEFQFLANQSIELEKRVALFHRNLTGQVPATAELNFLERVKWLDLYGCELHPIQYDENSNEEYSLGLNPSGVLVLRNKLKVAQYLWQGIVKTKCQGRCFLMDVIDQSAGKSGGPERNRFGFRLPDKEASRKLRWAVEEHKSFHNLIRSSATLNQLAQRQIQQQQQQHLKLGQRFRNSIRSAINVGHLGGMPQHLAQQQKLRSSMKSLSNQQQAAIQQQQYALDSRPPPTVVRMPSRRYSNRSLTRPAAAYADKSAAHQMAFNRLPHLQQASSQTMVESQRQQAIMMMNQFNQMGGMIGKSQTLKPVTKLADSKEAKRNPYYQMMMMMMAEQQQHHHQPEVAVLPPGRHIVQPSIYKASSVLNGVNQSGGQMQPSNNPPPVMGPAMMQFFNTRPQYPGQYHHGNGHESPRSTKSAIAPSSALKLASKKLAKQQQLLYSRNQQQDVQPLLAYDPSMQQQQQSMYSGPYYGIPCAYNLSSSANPSPRSVRSARIASRHKSKSTNENLHLLHQQQNPNKQYMQPVVDVKSYHQQLNNKMLLATTQMMQDHHQQSMAPPPPSYQHGKKALGNRHHLNSDNESELSKVSRRSAGALMSAGKKRATFALNNEQANLLLNTNGLIEAGRVSKQNQINAGNQARGLRASANGRPSDEDDYCCSRSDCSSLEEGGPEGANYDFRRRGNQQRNPLGSIQQASRPTNSQQAVLIGQQQQRRRRPSASGANQDYGSDAQQVGQNMLRRVKQSVPIDDQQEWNAIRKRHHEFSSGKGFLNGNLLESQRQLQQQQANGQLAVEQAADNSTNANGDPYRNQYDGYDEDGDLNNNSNNGNAGAHNGSQLVKSIANKQATPILLSLNYDHSNANNKAVQLLNLQRQQLNSQSSDGGTKSSSSAVDSAPSSVASSPKATSGGATNNQVGGGSSVKSSKTTDSTASSSSTTTSGYYAGSNSTGSASVDSDSHTTVDGHQPSSMKTGSKAAPAGRQQSAGGAKTSGYQSPFSDWQEEPGSRAKIALGSYSTPSARVSANRLLIGGHQGQQFDDATTESARQQQQQQRNQKQQFYLAKSDNDNRQNNQSHDLSQQWSPLNQIQQHAPSSLKYVSFDV